MSAVRRVYLYLLAFAGLSMLAIGVANLGRVLVEILSSQTTASYVREEVSQWGAAALVGLPVWLLHWRWAQQAALRDAGERSSTLRRLFVYGVLSCATLIAAQATNTALESFLAALGNERQTSQVRDALTALPFIAVAVVVWLFHWRVAQADRVAVGEDGGSATLRRWYVYGAAFIGWWFLLDGARALLEDVWRTLALLAAGSTADARDLLDAIPRTLVALGLWVGHWRWAPAAMGPAVVEQDSRSALRVVYLFLGLAVVVAGTLVGASQLLYYAIGRLLGIDEPGGVGGSLALAAAGPGSVVVVYGAGWAYQRLAIRQQEATAEGPRQAGIRRFYTYLVALVALATLAIGAGGMLWLVADAATRSAQTADVDWWRDRAALFATLALVGLPVWLIHWRPTSAVSLDEATSLSRRLYIYLALIGGSLALLVSAAAAAYLLLTLVLGAPATGSVASDVARTVATALVAGVVVGYHWQALRSIPSSPGAVEADEREVVAMVRLRAASEHDLAAALADLRGRGIGVEMLETLETEATPPGST